MAHTRQMIAFLRLNIEKYLGAVKWRTIVKQITVDEDVLMSIDYFLHATAELKINLLTALA